MRRRTHIAIERHGLASERCISFLSFDGPSFGIGRTTVRWESGIFQKRKLSSSYTHSFLANIFQSTKHASLARARTRTKKAKRITMNDADHGTCRIMDVLCGKSRFNVPSEKLPRMKNTFEVANGTNQSIFHTSRKPNSWKAVREAWCLSSISPTQVPACCLLVENAQDRQWMHLRAQTFTMCLGTLDIHFELCQRSRSRDFPSFS